MNGNILRRRYKIIRPLGTGAFGQTYLAQDRDLPGHPQCVVKKLKLQSAETSVLEMARRLFDTEAQVLYQLGSHDQIPQLFAHFEENQEFYLVQELIEGHDLKQEFPVGRRWSETQVIALLQDVLPVLEFVHQQDVIHRDIKPANLIRRASDGKLVLIDFGAVKQISSQILNSEATEALTVAIGTPGYMPNEQSSGKPRISSDIYAVGMLAIQALTGILPKRLREDPRTSEVIWRNHLEVGQAQDSPLYEILDKMVRYDFRQRYQSATEVLQALASLASNSTQTVTSFPKTCHQTTVSAVTPKQVSPTAIQLNREEYRLRKILLNKVRNFWVKGVLEKSLHGQAMMELGLESRFDLLERPWGLVWESLEEDRQTLPPGTRVIDKFSEMGEGRSLLILGEPGSGKTTTLLELVRDLLDQAEADASLPIPVVFNLSSWATGKQSIADWLVQELNTKYQASKAIGKDWVKAGKLLLLLDGLDEVRATLRDACVMALNKFSQEHGTTEMVVCSRLQDYQALKQRLKLQGAICLQPLNLKQIHQYLESAGAELAGINTALQEDNTLQELAKSPLMLSIMTLAYRGMSWEDLPRISAIEERRKHLFDTYIERMFKRRGSKKGYPKEKVKHWLSWLAKKMSQQSVTIFLIERLQPEWLDKNFYQVIYPFVFVAIFTCMIIWMIGLTLYQPSFEWLKLQLLFNAVIGGAIFGLSAGVIYGILWKLTFSTVGKRLVKPIGGMFAGLIYGLFLFIYDSWLNGFRFDSSSLTLLVTLELIYGLSGILLWIITCNPINPTETLRWSWENARNKIINGLSWGLSCGLILGFIINLHYSYFIFYLLDDIKMSLLSIKGSIIVLLSTGCGLLAACGLIGEMLGGLIGGLIGGLNRSTIETTTAPNQGIRQSGKNGIILALIGGLLLGIASWLLGFLFWSGVMLGLWFGLFGAWEACIKHLSLRLVLYFSGSSPWNYSRFLNYVTERIFLQKVGGGYIFVHRLLLEHFAKM
ncbi:MAG: protein kinase [Xenococcaceae cyanobacterium]